MEDVKDADRIVAAKFEEKSLGRRRHRRKYKNIKINLKHMGPTSLPVFNKVYACFRNTLNNLTNSF
jgi:hypothetical protein